MSTLKELSDQITKAMEGATDGPWTVIPATPYCGDDEEFEGAFTCPASIEGANGDPVCTFGSEDGSGHLFENEADYHYIAAVSPDNMRVILSALADAGFQSTADYRIAELEQQIANIKASRDLQVTIAADEEERARKAEAERETYEEILRVVCGHLELPQSESGPADDLSLYDRALEQADVMYCQTEAERVEHKNARYSAEAKLIGENRRFSVLIESKDETIRQLNEEVKTLRPKLSEAVKVIEQPFCVLFLDGRNEHGSHVLPSYPRSFEPVGDDIDDQAEAILVEAERLGFPIGEHVWAEFVDVPDQIGNEGRIEFSGYWEFKGINVEMSRVINASTLSKLEGSSHGKS